MNFLFLNKFKKKFKGRFFEKKFAKVFTNVFAKVFRGVFFNIFCGIFLFFASIIDCAQANNDATNNSGAKLHRTKNSQTRIRSDVIDIKQKSQKIDFIDNVLVEKDDISLLANKMSVFYFDKKQTNFSTNSTDNKSHQNSNLREIKATGNVKMFNDDFVASSDFATYNPQKNTFTLEQSVIVNNGSSVVSGDKFIYDLNTKKGDFISKKTNAKMLIENSVNHNNNKGDISNNKQDNKKRDDKGDNGGDDRVTVIIGNDIKEQKNNFIKEKY